MKKILFILITLLLLTACGSNGNPHKHFSQDEQIAYDFLKGMYSGNKETQKKTISKYGYNTGYPEQFVSNKVRLGYFNEQVKELNIIKSIRGTGTNHNTTYILVQLKNNKTTQEDIVIVSNHKIFDVHFSKAKSKYEEQLFNFLRKDFNKNSSVDSANSGLTGSSNSTARHITKQQAELEAAAKKADLARANDAIKKTETIEGLGKVTPIAFGFSDQLGLTGDYQIPIEPMYYGKSSLIINNIELVSIEPDINGSKLFHSANPVYAYMINYTFHNGYPAVMTVSPRKFTIQSNTDNGSDDVSKQFVDIPPNGKYNSISIIQVENGKLPTRAQLEMPAPSSYKSDTISRDASSYLNKVVPLKMQDLSHPVLIGNTY